MATIITEDACENNITLAPEEPQLPQKNTLEEPTVLKSQESISMRRDRSLTAFLFAEIAGKKLKCYEKWKLWLSLFICMTVIAVVAIAFASYYAVKVQAYESKTDAVDAQSNLIYDIVHDVTANLSDHSEETHKIFNTFDDNADGVWSFDEFYDHFVLGSIVSVFDGIDEDADDILSWSEIASSISRRSLSHAYIASVRVMYNITFANATDPVLNNYAANVYLDNYNIDEFGYITRAYFYEFGANTSFKQSDINHDNSISFAEFTRKIGNDQMISFLRQWNLESYLQSLNQTGAHNVYNMATAEATKMCPYNVATRRRLRGDSGTIEWQSGDLRYIYEIDGCEAELRCCTHDDCFSRSRKIPDLEELCANDMNQLVECMIGVIELYVEKDKGLVQCQIQADKCFQDHAAVFSDDCEGFHCDCECSDECKGHDVNYEDLFANNRRLLGNCEGQNCACGSGCTCFGGNNEMRIKREDRIQNVLLKDLRIGDYAQTKTGEWSKVWFIKEEEESEYEFLKLYFDEDEYITMTNHHLLYVNDRMEASMKRADEVKIGDTVFVMQQNDDSFVEKAIVFIESTISSDGAYAPVTMDGSIVVNNVLSSCYVESPEKAQRLHDTAGVFRWISSYDTNLASFMTHFFYDSFFMKLRTNYGLDAAHIVFNAYSMPCIVVATVNVVMFGFVRSFSSFL